VIDFSPNNRIHRAVYLSSNTLILNQIVKLYLYSKYQLKLKYYKYYYLISAKNIKTNKFDLK